MIARTAGIVAAAAGVVVAAATMALSSHLGAFGGVLLVGSIALELLALGLLARERRDTARRFARSKVPTRRP